MVRYKVLDIGNASVDLTELRQLGSNYVGEVGTSGVRSGALGRLQESLQEAMELAKDFQVANRTPQSTDVKGVKALAAFHTSQQTHVKDAKQAELNQAVIRFRTWLSRQGAWFKGDSGLHDRTFRPKVVYDTQLRQQDFTRIRINGGLLRTSDGKRFDTSRMVTHFSGPGFAIYVMSATGNLHSSSHSVGHRHHSSLLGGAAVNGAGELLAKDGKIRFLSNKSGHYHPGRNQLLAVLAMLQRQGVLLDFELKVVSQQYPGGLDYPSVDAFMRANRLDDASIDQAVRDLVRVESRAPSQAKYYEEMPNKAPAYYEKMPDSPPVSNGVGGSAAKYGSAYKKIIQVVYYN